MDNKTQIEKIINSSQNYIFAHQAEHEKFAKLGSWLEKESTILKREATNKTIKKPNFKRGQIIKVDFGINIGSELSNTHFAIVLNNDDNNSVDNLLVIPLTSKNGYKRLKVGNILKDFQNNNKYSSNGYALITQIRVISKSRIFNSKIKSFCDKKTMANIIESIIEYLTK